MERFIQAAGGILVAVMVNLVLRKRDKELALLLTLSVCAMVLVVCMGFLRPVIDFVQELGELGKLDPGWMGILLKAAGIGFLGEIAALICRDAGETAFGKVISILSGGVILWLSLPLLTGLLELIQQILEEL